MALSAGKNPASIPINMAKPMEANPSHGGIIDSLLDIPYSKAPARNLLIRNDTP